MPVLKGTLCGLCSVVIMAFLVGALGLAATLGSYPPRDFDSPIEFGAAMFFLVARYGAPIGALAGALLGLVAGHVRRRRILVLQCVALGSATCIVAMMPLMFVSRWEAGILGWLVFALPPVAIGVLLLERWTRKDVRQGGRHTD